MPPMVNLAPLSSGVPCCAASCVDAKMWRFAPLSYWSSMLSPSMSQAKHSSASSSMPIRHDVKDSASEIVPSDSDESGSTVAVALLAVCAEGLPEDLPFFL